MNFTWGAHLRSRTDGMSSALDPRAIFTHGSSAHWRAAVVEPRRDFEYVPPAMDRARFERLRLRARRARRMPTWMRAVRVHQPSTKRGVRSLRAGLQPSRFAFRSHGLRG